MVTWTNVWQSQELTKEMTSAGDQYTCVLIDCLVMSLSTTFQSISYMFLCYVMLLHFDSGLSGVVCLTLHVDAMHFLDSTFYS